MRLVLRTLGSLAISSAVMSLVTLAVLNGWDWRGPSDTLVFVATVFPFVVCCSALGLLVLMPLARLLARWGASFAQALLTLPIFGAGPGWLMIYSFPLVSASLGAIAGALTAATWTLANRDNFRSAART